MSGIVAAVTGACLYAANVSAALLPQSTIPLNTAAYGSGGGNIYVNGYNPFPQSVTVSSVTVSNIDYVGSMSVTAGSLLTSRGSNWWTFPYSVGTSTFQFPSPITLDASQVKGGKISLYSSPLRFFGAQYYSNSSLPTYCNGGCLINPNATVTWNQNLPTQIVSAGNTLCLNVYGGFTTSGTGIIQWGCDGGSNEIWTLTPIGDYYHLVAKNSGMCLNVAGGSNQVGVQLIQWGCQTSSDYNDQWSIVQLASGNYQIVSRSSGLCVNMAGDGAVTQGECQVSSSQLNEFKLPQLPPAWGPRYTL
jgi:hypothetical protein